LAEQYQKVALVFELGWQRECMKLPRWDLMGAEFALPVVKRYFGKVDKIDLYYGT